MDGEEICDARFSKCCGGITEEFQYCWEDTPKTYLTAVRDIALGVEHTLPNLTNEEAAEKVILELTMLQIFAENFGVEI